MSALQGYVDRRYLVYNCVIAILTGGAVLQVASLSYYRMAEP